MPDQPETTAPCICCGEPATAKDIDGTPLCEGDYQHLAEHWRREFCEREDGDAQS